MPCQESTGRRERSSWSRQEEARRVRKKLVIASELRQESLSQGPAAAWVDVRSSLPLQQELLVIAPRVSCHEHLIKAHRSSSCQEAAVNGAYSTSRQFVIVSSLLHLSCEQSRSSRQPWLVAAGESVCVAAREPSSHQGASRRCVKPPDGHRSMLQHRGKLVTAFGFVAAPRSSVRTSQKGSSSR